MSSKYYASLNQRHLITERYVRQFQVLLSHDLMFLDFECSKKKFEQKLNQELSKLHKRLQIIFESSSANYNITTMRNKYITTKT